MIAHLLAVLLLALAHRDSLPPGARMVIIQHDHPTNLGRMIDTLFEIPARPRPRHAVGIALRGELTIFNAAMAALTGATGGETDTFTVQLPSVREALMQLHVGGATLKLRAVRDTVIPPWVTGQPPALPGVAWRARMYLRDTLLMWGYDADGAWEGHLALHTTTPTGRDTTYQGVWRTFGPATALPARRHGPPRQIKFKPADRR